MSCDTASADGMAESSSPDSSPPQASQVLPSSSIVLAICGDVFGCVEGDEKLSCEKERNG